MNKSAIPAALLLIATGLSGCPIYDDDAEACRDDLDCGDGRVCDDRTGACVEPAPVTACKKPSGCSMNETCARSATCMPGDCHFASIGCVRGYECLAEDDRWQCVPEGQGQGGSDAGGGAPSGGGMSGGGTPSEANAGAGPQTSGGTVGEAGAG